MNDGRKSRERKLIEDASRLFEQSVDSLDGSTRSRLAGARAQAIEVAQSGRGGRRWFGSTGLVPVGGAAAVVLALVLVWPGTGAPDRSAQTEVFNDLDILLENQDLELIEELEFYAWLLEQPEVLESIAVGGGSG